MNKRITSLDKSQHNFALQALPPLIMANSKLRFQLPPVSLIQESLSPGFWLNPPWTWNSEQAQVKILIHMY